MPPRSVPSLSASDVLGRALLPLRAFLGFTFCYAGLQKLANPAFFDATSPISIQAQLAGASRRSPVHALISPLGHIAVAIGILIALGELAVGLGTLLGLWARIAAAGGIALSFLLFLTVSFHAAPYYTGADIVFVFAWTPILLAGAPMLSLDALIASRPSQPDHPEQPQPQSRRPQPKSQRPKQAATAATPATKARSAPRGERQRASGESVTARRVASGGSGGRSPLKDTVTASTSGGRGVWSSPPSGLFATPRRNILTAAAGLAGLALAGLAAGLGRLAHGAGSKPGTTALSTPTPTSSPTQATNQGPVVAGKAIGPAADVPVGQAASFTDPSTGDPSIVIQPKAGEFLAFDAVCPHAGCTVQYDPSAKVIICPCHGSQFNAATGAVEVGPAAAGLTKISISNGQNGQLYVS